MKRRAKGRESVTGEAYRLGHTIEILRGHIVELEVLLRDLALSGTASNEDLGAELVKLAGRVAHNAAALERSCRRIASMPAPRLCRRPTA